MKLRNIFTALAAAALAFVGCQEEERFLDEVQVSKSMVAISIEGASAEITVTANDSWEITDIPEWLTVAPATGAAGETVVTFSAEASEENREALVYVNCAGVSQVVNVLQMAEKVPAPLTDCATVLAENTPGKVYKIKGTVTDTYNYEKYGCFYVNDGTAEVYVYGSMNPTQFDTEVGDIITFEGPWSSYGNFDDITILELEKSLIKVEKVSPKGALSLDGDVFSVALTCKGEGIEIQLPEGVDWITYEEEPFVSGTTTIIEFAVAPNNGGARSAVITFVTVSGGVNYTAVAEIEQLGAIAEVSVEDFLAAEEGKALYKLTGKVANLKAGDYGNFDLVDATGSVYVYGLTATQVESNDKSFPSLGIKEGDIVTLIGTRASYNGTAQVGGPAYYVSHVGHTEATVAEFIAAAEDDTRYKLTGTISNIALKDGEVSPYGNFDLTDETGTVYVYGLTVAPVDKNDQSFLELGLKEGDKVTIIGTRTSYKGTVQVGGPAYYISHEAAGSDTPDTPAEPETPAGFEAGNYWIMGTKDDVTKVMTPLAADKTYGYAASAEVTDGASTEANVFTFTAVEGGFTIQDASGRYYYQEEGTPHKTFSVSDELPANGGVWTVAADSGNTYTITSAASGKVIGYAEGTYTSFGVYGEGEGEGSVHPTLVKVAK